MERITRVGVVGSGFLSRHFVLALEKRKDLRTSKVLTRSDIFRRSDFPRQDLLTNSVDELISSSDLVVECSGDAVYATEVVAKIMEASLPVITMDSEFQVTTGSYFARRGFITEAEGDQTGSLAALRENLLQMGFRPLVYGNIKRFLNHSPTREEMEFWARKQGYSLDMTVSFTDGTKLQLEQALVANGLGVGIAKPGLLGPLCEDVESGGQTLAREAKRLGYPISDYILCPYAPAGVFIVAEHDECQELSLKDYKLGSGPYYVLLQSFHLCHLEIPKTIRRVLNGGGVLLNNGERPSVSVAAIAKRDLKVGEIIRRGIGSFEVRGIAVRISENKGHVPIGLLSKARVAKPIKEGEQISFDKVELPPSLALKAWQEIEQSVVS